MLAEFIHDLVNNRGSSAESNQAYFAALQRLTAEGWLRDYPGDAMVALAPGALSVAVCIAVILAVFRHFHHVKH